MFASLTILEFCGIFVVCYLIGFTVGCWWLNR